MNKANLYLVASLASHRRGNVLTDILPVQRLPSEEELPNSGALILFGQDWQSFSVEQQAQYWIWLKEGGRQVLLIPPFREGPIDNALDWQAKSIKGELSSEIGLAAYLKGEVKFEFQAVARQFDRDLGHCWDNDSINTLYYKPHASGGLFSVSSLPLWSLSCLDEIDLVHTWFESLYSFAGFASLNESNSAGAEDEETAQIKLKEEHLALLCCSYGQALIDQHALISRVHRLGVFRLEGRLLELAAEELIKSGLLFGGEITDEGTARLMASPYKIYAEELMRMPG